MNDQEIDMEELEARLYGQVHHGSTEDGDMLDSKAPPTSMSNESCGKTFRRYFEEEKRQQFQYNPETARRSYYTSQNQNRAYYPGNPNPFQSFYNQYGLVTLPELVLNPAVNNIVVLPPPPTQIFTQQLPDKNQELWEKLEKRRERRRNKRREKRAFKRAQEFTTKMNNQKVFKEHRLNCPANLRENKTYSKEHSQRKRNLNETSKNLKLCDEVICLTESDNSDCETIQPVEQAVVVVESSDDEGNKNTSVTEIKQEETLSKVNMSSKDKTENGIAAKVLTNTDKEVENRILLSQNSDVTSTEDDVIVVESSEQNEIITIDCDDSQSLNITYIEVLDTTITVPSSEITDNMLSQERKELLETPESTSNDFLDSTLNLSQSNCDEDVNTSRSEQSVCADNCETESSCSTNDFEVPSRSAIFNEEAFDTPTKEAFAEFNLDSFTDYIGSKGNVSAGIPSILTPARKSIGSKAIKGKSSKCKSTVSSNSSDSSSESDYNDSKSALIEKSAKNKKTAKQTKNKSNSESDENDSVILNQSNAPLPNLSPITSDEEVDVVENRSRQSRRRKREKIDNVSKREKKTENAHVCGEKRKSNEVVNPVENKKSKCNEDVSPKTIEIFNELLEINSDKDDDSSDEYSEVEINSDVCEKDIELLNVSNFSNVISVPLEEPANKPERFADYWTDDMHKFYFESWGGEDFDIAEKQKKMTDDPEMWKIIERDRININLTPRGPRCHRCKEFGHRALNCNKKFDPPKCILCGASGHFEARCRNKVCTSCGRKSHFFTTYCSRCSHSRHALCNICHIRGHSAFNCTDVWRRYHLTTKLGPPIQPSKTTMKANKDRWCSGCASRGHFEHDCHYYNRTHPPANPFVYTYKDVYNYSSTSGKNNNKNQAQNETKTTYNDKNCNDAAQNTNYGLSLDHRTTNTSSVQKQITNNTVPNTNTNTDPWISSFGSNSNFIPLISQVASNKNYYQQLPANTPANIPSLLNLQIPFQSENNRNKSPEAADMLSDINPDGSFNTNQNTQSIENLYANLDQSNRTNHPCSEVSSVDEFVLQLDKKYTHELLQQDGIEFLKELSKDTDLKIKVRISTNTREPKYICTLEGGNTNKPKAKKAIERFCKPSLNLKHIRGVFCTTGFNVRILKENLAKLNDPDVEWKQIGKTLYKRVARKENQIRKKEVYLQKNKSDKETRRLRILKKNFEEDIIVLNIIVLGKLKAGGGHRHMQILEQWLQESNEHEINDHLRKSFNYVFKNVSKINVNYQKIIRNLPDNKLSSLQHKLQDYLRVAIDICKKKNAMDLAKGVKDAYQAIILNDYSKESVESFYTCVEQTRK